MQTTYKCNGREHIVQSQTRSAPSSTKSQGQNHHKETPKDGNGYEGMASAGSDAHEHGGHHIG